MASPTAGAESMTEVFEMYEAAGWPAWALVRSAP